MIVKETTAGRLTALSLYGSSWNSPHFHAGSHLGICPPINFAIEWMLNEKASIVASCITFGIFSSITGMPNGRAPTLEKRLVN